MEDINKTLIKAIAGILILILALNVYRTESTIKKLDALSIQVDSLFSRVYALENPDYSKLSAEPLSNLDGKTVKELAKGLVQLQSKVSAIQRDLKQLSSAQSIEHKSNDKSTNSNLEVSTLSKTVSALEAKVNNLQKALEKENVNQLQSVQRQQPSAQPISSNSTRAYERVYVTAKARVENRYIDGKTPLPNVSSGPSGTIVVNITINNIGLVGSVSIDKSSTISDEEIRDLCKEAALKTRFSFNPEAPNRVTGTITYSFTAK